MNNPARTLSSLTAHLPVTAVQANRPLPSLPITNLTDDSRQASPGCLFIAQDGTQKPGLDFAEKAIAAGAIALLADSRHITPLQALASAHPDVTFLHSPDLRAAAGTMAARFFQPQPAAVVAVTGTDGKSSTVHFTRQLWEGAGLPAASLGTVGVEGTAVPENLRIDLGNTTPGNLALHRCLHQLAHAGITHVAMEASSHGLDQQRLAGLHISTAAYTNLSRDHLDYHGTMDAYFQAKARLFTDVLSAQGTAVINRDDARAEMLLQRCTQRGVRTLTYGRDEKADIRILHNTPLPTGQAAELQAFGQRWQLSLPLFGGFQLYNLCAAMGMATLTGVDAALLPSLLPQVQSVPGRMEMMGTTRNGAAALVDYAHTPSALENLLKAARPHCLGRLWVVFGCGGDRDKGKRPEMGRAAGNGADIAIVTDDNPRTEDAATIREEILAGMQQATARVEAVAGRRQAIAYALQHAQDGDVVVFAGKGHETTQTIGTIHHPFHERNIVRALLATDPASSQHEVA